LRIPKGRQCPRVRNSGTSIYGGKDGRKGGGAESGTDIGNELKGKSERESKMEKEFEREMAMDLYSTSVGQRESSRVPIVNNLGYIFFLNFCLDAINLERYEGRCIEVKRHKSYKA
jgi:hypothetical protein